MSALINTLRGNQRPLVPDTHEDIVYLMHEDSDELIIEQRVRTELHWNSSYSSETYHKPGTVELLFVLYPFALTLMNSSDLELLRPDVYISGYDRMAAATPWPASDEMHFQCTAMSKARHNISEFMIEYLVNASDGANPNMKNCWDGMNNGLIQPQIATAHQWIPARTSSVGDAGARSIAPLRTSKHSQSGVERRVELWKFCTGARIQHMSDQGSGAALTLDLDCLIQPDNSSRA
eukprot:gene10052-7945_t